MFRFVRPVLASLTIAGVAATMNEPTHAAGNAQRGKQYRIGVVRAMS